MTFLIIGAGQSGRLAADIASRIPHMKCAGFLDSNPSLHGKIFFGIPVIGSLEELESFIGKIDGVLPMIGDLCARLKVFKRCVQLGFRLVDIIDPSVQMASDLKLGKGNFISSGTIFLTNVKIGDFAFIGTGVNILHDTIIGSNCIIGGGTTIGASVTVGCNVSFGVGVNVASGRKLIGNNVRAAAGSVILKDVPENAVIIGNPARIIGYNQAIDEN